MRRLALETAPKRRSAYFWRPLHDDEARCSTRRLPTISAMISSEVVDALAAMVAQREGERRGEIGASAGVNLSRAAIGGTIAGPPERARTIRGAIVSAVMLLAAPASVDSPDISL